MKPHGLLGRVPGNEEAMECKVCGRKPMNENANFCDYCGASFRGNLFDNYSGAGNASAAGPVNRAESREYAIPDERSENNTGDAAAPTGLLEALFGGRTKSGAEKPMSFGNWLSLFAVIFIPYVGILLFLALLVYWAIGKNTTETKKNFARAGLIFCVVLFFLYVAVMAVFFSTLENPQAWLQNLMSSMMVQ